MIPSWVWTSLFLAVHGGVVTSLIVFERRRPTSTMAWLLALIFMPVVGLALYLLFGPTRARRHARRYAAIIDRVRPVLTRHDVRAKLACHDDPEISPLAEILLRLGRSLTQTPASPGNRVTALVDARAAYPAIFDAIAGARDHVHVFFYIIQPDEVGRSLRDALVGSARRGVTVRVACDAVGSSRLPWSFWKPLLDAGGQVAYFRPIARLLARLPRRERFDFRNHRKVVVVDGRSGFTGGINVGREYLGLDHRTGFWRDTHLRIDGPAVLALQKAFAADWLEAAGELLDDARYFPAPAADPGGSSTVQIVDSGPDREYPPISFVLVQAMALARRRLWITTPYFVPDAPVEQALMAAALRGVDVRLLVPCRSDAPIVTYAAETYYPDLLQAGVRVFRYERGFVHAKTMVVDDWAATVGSANLDMRSFHLNYEINAFVYDRSFADSLAAQFLEDLEHAEELPSDYDRRVSIPRRALQSVARMLSPLL